MFYLRQPQSQPQYYHPYPAHYPTWTQPQAYDADYIDSPYGVDPDEAFVEAKRQEYLEALELQRQRRQFEQEIEYENLRHQAQLRAIAQREAQRRHLTTSSPYVSSPYGHSSALGAAGRYAPVGGRRQSPFYHGALPGPRRAPVFEDPQQSLLEDLLGIPSLQPVVSQTQMPIDCRNISHAYRPATTSAPASCERRVRFTPSPAPSASQAVPRPSAPAVDANPRHTTEQEAKGKRPEIDFTTHLLNTLFNTSFVPERPQQPTQASSTKFPEKATQSLNATIAPSTSQTTPSNVAPKPATSNHDGLAAHGSDSEEAHSSDAPKRAQALAAISALAHTFETLRRTFTFPSGPLDRVPGSDLPRLASNQHNAPIHAYESALSELLTKLDSIESHGFEGVREARKALVRKIEGELESLEKKVAEALAGAATPVLIPIEVEAPTSTAAGMKSTVEEQAFEKDVEMETEVTYAEQPATPFIEMEEAKDSVEGYDVEMGTTEPVTTQETEILSPPQQLTLQESESSRTEDVAVSASVEEPSEQVDSVLVDHPQPTADSTPAANNVLEESPIHVTSSLDEPPHTPQSTPTLAGIYKQVSDLDLSNLQNPLNTTDVATDLDQKNSQSENATKEAAIASSKRHSPVTVEDEVDPEDGNGADRDFELL